jgi:hypothetical protein
LVRFSESGRDRLVNYNARKNARKKARTDIDQTVGEAFLRKRIPEESSRCGKTDE